MRTGSMTIISLLSDFGLTDSYVAEIKAVILSINPTAAIVDVTHQIPKYNIRSGAFALASVTPYFPKGTVHLAVVDPGVGSKRKPIVVETKKSIYVGPDNGLLMLAANAEGINQVFEITQKRLIEDRTSNTFHGRDIFAPVTAYLSKGVRPTKIGKVIRTYLQPSLSSAIVTNGFIDCEILHVDSFGNAVTNVAPKDLHAIGVHHGVLLRIGNHQFSFVRTYSDVTKRSLLGLIGSHGFLEIASNQGNAARLLHLKTGKKLHLRVTC
jgi:hypothetical protein